MKTINRKTKTRIIIIGFLCALIITEIGLRGIGLLFYHIQRKNNAVDLSGDNPIKILCLGDSMTACGWGFDPLAMTFGVIPRLKSNSWPAQLQDRLDIAFASSSSKTKFQVINMAIVAHPFVTEYFANHIDTLLDEFEPAVLICMMGMNGILTKSAFKTDLKTGGSFKNFWHSIKLFNLLETIYSSYKMRWLINCDSPLYKPWKKLMHRFGIWSLSSDIRKLKEQMKDPNKKGESEIIYDQISKALFFENAFELLDDITAQYLEYHPQCAIAQCFRGLYFFLKGDDKMANHYFEEGERKEPPLEWIRHFTYAEHLADIERAGQSMTKLLDVLAEYELTPRYRKNYEIIVEEALKRNITVIAMQYPRCDVMVLKKNLSDFENIEFVSNQENFEKSLESMTADKLFKDRYALIFGHCTEYGYGLIAENVYEKLINLFQLL